MKRLTAAIREAGHAPSPGVPGPPPPRRGKSVETPCARTSARSPTLARPPRSRHPLTAFAEFLKARRAARSFSHPPRRGRRPRHPGPRDPRRRGEAPASQEIAANEAPQRQRVGPLLARLSPQTSLPLFPLPGPGAPSNRRGGGCGCSCRARERGEPDGVRGNEGTPSLTRHQVQHRQGEEWAASGRGGTGGGEVCGEVRREILSPSRGRGRSGSRLRFRGRGAGRRTSGRGAP